MLPLRSEKHARITVLSSPFAPATSIPRTVAHNLRRIPVCSSGYSRRHLHDSQRAQQYFLTIRGVGLLETTYQHGSCSNTHVDRDPTYELTFFLRLLAWSRITPVTCVQGAIISLVANAFTSVITGLAAVIQAIIGALAAVSHHPSRTSVNRSELAPHTLPPNTAPIRHIQRTHLWQVRARGRRDRHDRRRGCGDDRPRRGRHLQHPGREVVRLWWEGSGGRDGC